MPRALFWSKVRLLSRLRAEESILTMNDRAAAAGRMEKQAYTRHTGSLQRAAEGGRRSVRPAKATLAGMASAGILVVAEEVK